MTLHQVDRDHPIDDGVVDSAALFERRRWRRRLLAWRPRLIGCLLVLVAVFVCWVVLFSSWLGMHQLDVDGLHRVTDAEVTAAANIAPGTPLARVNLDAVQARVEAIPAVASATVHRGWPHTIVVTVTERQPVAAVHADGSWWLMDRTGALFGSAADPEPGRPIVEAGARAGHPDAQPGGHGARSAAGRRRRSDQAGDRFVEDSISLHLTNGAEVHWGSASDSDEKADVLRALLDTRPRSTTSASPPSPPTKG